jgi:lipoyl(octanoyl) transferase
LLGVVDLDTLLAIQQGLHRAARDDGQPAVIVCEHDVQVTVGRSGSHRHLNFDDGKLGAHKLAVRWLNRGGGCWLHAPGQLAVYVLLPLPAMGLTIPNYLQALGLAIARACQALGLEQPVRYHDLATWLGDRPIGCLGVAIADWTTSFGAVLNVHPPLEPFRRVRSGPEHPTMTSLQRASRRPLRLARVRELLVESLAESFGFAATHVFTDHPLLRRRVRRDPVLAAR